MSLISEKIIDDFALWAEEHENKEIFPAISQEESSYYIERNIERTYIMEYNFQDMSAIRKALEDYSGLASEAYILKKLTIELCQSRYVSRLSVKCSRDDSCLIEENKKKQDMLPEFRYEF